MRSGIGAIIFAIAAPLIVAVAEPVSAKSDRLLRATIDRPSAALHPEPTSHTLAPVGSRADSSVIRGACKDRLKLHQTFIGTTSDWLTASDYPAEAAAQGAQGTVAAQVMVSAVGLLSVCTVMQSSGHPALDKATCPLLMQRSRFTVTLHADGCSPPAATRTIRHTWRLPEQ